MSARRGKKRIPLNPDDDLFHRIEAFAREKKIPLATAVRCLVLKGLRAEEKKKDLLQDIMWEVIYNLIVIRNIQVLSLKNQLTEKDFQLAKTKAREITDQLKAEIKEEE